MQITSILTLIALLAGSFARAQAKPEKARPATLQTAADTCEHFRNSAREDYKNSQLKYYYFGIAGPSPAVVNKLRKHHIRAVSNGCVPDAGLVCYNKIVDSILLAMPKK